MVSRYLSQSDSIRFRTGEAVPETGIYRVNHSRHRLHHEAILCKDERFPRCAKCSDHVLFELAYSAPDLFSGFRPPIYELPVIEEKSASAKISL